MKLALLLVGIPVLVNASPPPSPEIAKIKEAYRQFKTASKSNVKVELQRTLCGSGDQRVRIELSKTGAVVAYNFAARPFYDEYVWTLDGKLIFHFAKEAGWRADHDHEARLYFDDEKLIQYRAEEKLSKDSAEADNPDVVRALENVTHSEHFSKSEFEAAAAAQRHAKLLFVELGAVALKRNLQAKLDALLGSDGCKDLH